jgi:hypothetical protein
MVSKLLPQDTPVANRMVYIQKNSDPSYPEDLTGIPQKQPAKRQQEATVQLCLLPEAKELLESPRPRALHCMTLQFPPLPPSTMSPQGDSNYNGSMDMIEPLDSAPQNQSCRQSARRSSSLQPCWEISIEIVLHKNPKGGRSATNILSV